MSKHIVMCNVICLHVLYGCDPVLFMFVVSLCDNSERTLISPYRRLVPQTMHFHNFSLKTWCGTARRHSMSGYWQNLWAGVG